MLGEWEVIRETEHLKINEDTNTQLKKFVYDQVDDRNKIQMLIQEKLLIHISKSDDKLKLLFRQRFLFFAIVRHR